MAKLQKLRALDVFSGIGGIALGLKDYCETIAYCEIDEYCQSILQARMTDGSLDTAPIATDIAKLNRQTLKEVGIEEIDIICGGFPCQDLSVAGSRAGLDGERSGLFHELLRIANEMAVPWIFLENVGGLLSKHFYRVAGSLSESGYDYRWTAFPASDVGAPHRRERVFILAYTTSKRPQSPHTSEEQRIYPIQEGKMGDNQSRYSGKIRGKIDGIDIGSEPWQESEPTVALMDDGLPKDLAKQVKAIGNSVVPLQAKTAFERLVGFDTSWLLIGEAPEGHVPVYPQEGVIRVAKSPTGEFLPSIDLDREAIEEIYAWQSRRKGKKNVS